MQVARAQREQGAHQARDDFQHVQALAGEHLQQALRVVGDFIRKDVHGGAEHWRGEELPHRNVERHRSGLGIRSAALSPRAGTLPKMLLSMPRCSIITPFGVPVDPEVNST